jgi:hypothetical protein
LVEFLYPWDRPRIYGAVLKIVIKVHMLKRIRIANGKSFISWDSVINMIYRARSKKRENDS